MGAKYSARISVIAGDDKAARTWSNLNASTVTGHENPMDSVGVIVQSFISRIPIELFTGNNREVLLTGIVKEQGWVNE